MKNKSRWRKRSRKGGDPEYVDLEIEIAKKAPEIKNFPGWHGYKEHFYQFDSKGKFMKKTKHHPKSIAGIINRGKDKIGRTIRKQKEKKINQDLLERHHAAIGTQTILNKYTEGKYTAKTMPEENMKRMVADGIITQKKYNEIMKERKNKGGKRKKTRKKRRKRTRRKKR